MYKYIKKYALLLIIFATILLLQSCKHETIADPVTDLFKPEPAAELPVSALVGKWKTIDDETGKERSIVEVYEVEGKFYGKIIELLLSEDKGKICERCTGEDKNKPVLGLVLLKNIAKDGDEYSGGTILDPDNGKVYKCSIELLNKGEKLKLRGYVGLSLMGRTQYWYRVK